MKLMALIAAIAITVTLGAYAESTKTIHLAGAQARPTAPGATTGVVYLTVMNHGVADDTLTSVTTPVADAASMHRTTDENGIMKMEPVASIPLKANDAVSFKPGGLHIMLTGLKQQLKLGDSFPITLTFTGAGPVTATVTVGRIAPEKHDMGAMPGMKM